MNGNLPDEKLNCSHNLFHVFFQAWGNNVDIRFLTNNDGLSNSSINCILQDSTNLLWFGTWDGLNMYNSREFKVFKPDPSSANSISNNIIRNIIEEKKGVLWIATDYGINKYEVEQNQFHHYFCSNAQNSIFKEQSFIICKNTSNTIFASVNAYGIYYFDDHNNDFVPLKLSDTTMAVKTMFFDYQNQLWVHTLKNELFQISLYKTGNEFKVEHIKQVATQKNIESVFYDQVHKKIWIQLANNELQSIDLLNENRLLKQLAFPNRILSMLFFQDHCLLGSIKALYQMDFATASLTEKLKATAVLSLYKGEQDILWIGTDAQGVWMLTDSEEKFKTFSAKNIPEFGNSPVRAFFEDHNSTLWVGTKGNGLFAIKPDIQHTEKPVETTRFTTDNGLLSNSVYALAKSSRLDLLWIGTEGKGLNYYNYQSKKLYKLKENAPINRSSVYAIYLQNDTTLWVETSGSGLYGSKCEIAYQLENYNKEWIHMGASGTIVFSNLPAGNYVLNVKCSNANKEWSENIYSIPIKINPPWWLSNYAYLAYILILFASVYIIYRNSKNRMEIKHRLELKMLEG